MGRTPSVTRALLASAIALSFVGTGGAAPAAEAPGASEAAAPAAAGQAQATSDASAPDAAPVGDGATDAAPVTTLTRQAMPAAAASIGQEQVQTLRDATTRVVGATMERDLYGEPAKSMELTYHNRTVNFEDIDGGVVSDRTSPRDEQALFRKAVSQQIDDWSALAFNIFGYADTSNSKLFSDHADNGFEKDFGSGAHYLNLYDALKGDANSSGKTGEDCWRSSGLSYAGSLAGAYDALTDQLAAALGGSGRTTGADVREHCPIDALSGNTDSQTVIYTNVVQVDRKGSSPKYYCNGFGIAFYDFEVHPLSDGGPLNVAPEGSDGFEYSSKDDEQTFVTQSVNNGFEDATVSVGLAKSSASSISNSTSVSESTSFGQSIGVDVTYEHAFSKANKLTVGVNAGLSFEEAYATAYGTESSVETSLDESSTVSVTLPAHTVACTKQTSAESTVVQSYDEPLGITFKVAIYSLNAECYQDDGCVSSFATAGYDQYTFCTLFGGASNLSTDAAEALYQRAVNHKGEGGYEQTYGAVTTWGRYGHDKLIDAIDWDSVLEPRSGTAADVGSRLAGMTATYPMSVDGATMSVNASSVDTELMEAQPLYPISSIVVKWQLDRTKEMTVGDELAISSQNVSRVTALDKDAVEYYGFVPSSGTWKIVDKAGNETEPTAAKIVTDDVTHEQTVVALAPGETYVKYFIPEDTYVDAYGDVSTNANISSPAYKITVAEEAVPSFSGTLVLEGSAQVTVGLADNLNEMGGFDVAAYDATGREVEAAVCWEAQELPSRGIQVSSDGSILATEAGTFHVRAYVDDVYSDWMEVTAVEAEPAEPEAPADAGEDPSAPSMGTLATYIYQYGVSHGLISGNPSDGFTQGDFYVMGVLYCAAVQMGLVSEQTQVAVDECLVARFGDAQVEAWRQQALEALAEAGVIPAPDDSADAPAEPETDEPAPAEPAPAEPEAIEPEAVSEEPAAEDVAAEPEVAEEAAPAEEPAVEEAVSPYAGVWVCVDAQRKVELVLDPRTPTALLTWDRQDGVLGTWSVTSDGLAALQLGEQACPAWLEDDVLMVDYEGRTLQFLRSVW